MAIAYSISFAIDALIQKVCGSFVILVEKSTPVIFEPWESLYEVGDVSLGTLFWRYHSTDIILPLAPLYWYSIVS